MYLFFQRENSITLIKFFKDIVEKFTKISCTSKTLNIIDCKSITKKIRY